MKQSISKYYKIYSLATQSVVCGPEHLQHMAAFLKSRQTPSPFPELNFNKSSADLCAHKFAKHWFKPSPRSALDTSFPGVLRPPQTSFYSENSQAALSCYPPQAFFPLCSLCLPCHHFSLPSQTTW